MDDIAGILASDGDNVDSLMIEINNFINSKPVESPPDAGCIKSREELMNMRIKKEDGSGYISVSSLTKGVRREATGEKVSSKQKNVKKPSLSKSKVKAGPRCSKLPKQDLVTAFSVKQEPLSSDDEFSEIVKNSSNMQINQNPINPDYLEPSTSSGKSKSFITATQSSGNVAHGFKLNATPVVIMERLDPSAIVSISQKVRSANEEANKASNVSSEENRSSGSKRTDKKSVIRRSTSSTASVSSNPKIKTIVQASPSATDIDADKSKSDTATKIMTKQFLATGDSHLSEQSVSPETTRFELSLCPIVLADLSSEPFRKFMNLALDCVVHFRKNQNQPLFGNICLYFGDFITLQSAMQRLCQLSIKAHSMRLSGTIKCYDFKRLKNKSEEEPAKRSLSGRLMFQFCGQRIEKLQQLASVKDRKKESTKMRSAIVNKVPALTNKEMLLLLFPFSLDVTMPGDKQQKGLKGPVSIAFESQEWMEAVMDCIRDQSVNMSSSSETELGTFRLYVKNYTPPKIPIDSPQIAPKTPLMSTQLKPSSPANRGRGRGLNIASRGKGGPNIVQRASTDSLDGRNKEKENTTGRAEQRPNFDIRKRPFEESPSRFQFNEKRGRFDVQKRTGTPSEYGSSLPVNQQAAADPKEAMRLAAIARGLDPNNPDVIKILEMSSQLQAMQMERDQGFLSGDAGPGEMRAGVQQLQGENEQQRKQLPSLFENREFFGLPRRPSQQRDRALVSRDPHDMDPGRSGGHPRPDHRRDQDLYHRIGDGGGNGPKQFAPQREGVGHSEFSQGSFRNGPRDRDSTGLHSRSRSRDKPNDHILQRDRNQSGNRSRSPQKSTSSSSSGSTQRGFEQWRGKEYTRQRHWEPDKMSSSVSYFDPSTNDQPLDFQRPAPTLSTEQAVQQDMARTMQQALQGGDEIHKQRAVIPHGSIGREAQHQPPAEELVLPLQFGKNATKKTPQAIMEEKCRKEREERQKIEMKLKQKRDEEEKQRREKEMEERHKREREETERREKELEVRQRNMEATFTVRKDWPRSESHYNDQLREQCEPFQSFRPQHFPRDPKVIHAGVRFQGEENFQMENFQPEDHKTPESMRWKDDSPNIWDRADKAESSAQRVAIYRPNQGGFQRDDQALNQPGRGSFNHNDLSFGRRTFEEASQDRPTNIWDAHDQNQEDPHVGPSNRMAARGRPRGRWSDEGVQRFESTNIWHPHHEADEGAEGGHNPERKIHASSGLRGGRRPAGQILINRGGHSRDTGDEEHTGQDFAASNMNREVFRGRRASRAVGGGLLRASNRGRITARGSFGFHAEAHQRHADYQEPEHHFENEASGNAYDDSVSDNTSLMVYTAREKQRDSPHRRLFKNRDELDHQGAAASYENENYWNEVSGDNLSKRGGLHTAHSPRHLLSGLERGKGRRLTHEIEHTDSEWSGIHQDESNQFQQTLFSEGHVEPRIDRGRRRILRPGRGFMGRGRGLSSFGRGFENSENAEESKLVDSQEELSERVSEFQVGREVNDQEFRAQVQRGRGLGSREVSTGRGAENQGRGMLSSRGADNGGRGMHASRGRGMLASRGRGVPSSRGADNRGRGLPSSRGADNRGRGVPSSTGADNRGRGMPSSRGTDNRDRGVPSSTGADNRGRGMPSSRGTEFRGGRGLSLGRGTENQRGRGGLNRQHPSTFEGQIVTGPNRGESWEGQYGEMHQQGRVEDSVREVQNTWERGSGWGPGRGTASSRGSGSFSGRGVIREATRGGIPFRGRARGLLPHPM